MTNPNYTDIKYEIGVAYQAIQGTTSTVVKSLISKAQKKIKSITGTTSGSVQDESIRSLSSAYSIRHAMLGLGPESVNNDAYESAYNMQIEECKESLRSIGRTLDGVRVKFNAVND